VGGVAPRYEIQYPDMKRKWCVTDLKIFIKRKKWRFSLKSNFLSNFCINYLAVFKVKNANIFDRFFGENISLNLNIGPRPPRFQCNNFKIKLAKKAKFSTLRQNQQKTQDKPRTVFLLFHSWLCYAA
jgi:hypothetical protein